MSTSPASIIELVEQLKKAKPLESPGIAAEIAKAVAVFREVREQVASAASALNETIKQVRQNAPEIEKAVAALQSPEVQRAIEAASKSLPTAEELRPALEAIEQMRRSGVLSQLEEYQRRAAEIVRLIGDLNSRI